MSPTQFTFLVMILMRILGSIFCYMVIIPERVKVNYLNPKYVNYSVFNVRHYSRNSPYMVNLDTQILQTWTNNVSYEMIFYERLGNEYKRSFVEMKFKFCDMLEFDEIVGKAMKDAGAPSCPVPAGKYILHNMTIFRPQWRFVFPFQRARADSSFVITKTGEVIGNFDMYLNFVNIKKREPAVISTASKNSSYPKLSKT